MIDHLVEVLTGMVFKFNCLEFWIIKIKTVICFKINMDKNGDNLIPAPVGFIFSHVDI